MSIVNEVGKNNRVYFTESVARYFINSLKYRPTTQLNKSQASIIGWHTPNMFHFLDPFTDEVIEFSVTALKSYNTMVYACISVILSDGSHHLYSIEWTGYSATTSQHVAKFKNRLRSEGFEPDEEDQFKFNASWD